MTLIKKYLAFSTTTSPVWSRIFEKYRIRKYYSIYVTYIIDFSSVFLYAIFLKVKPLCQRLYYVLSVRVNMKIKRFFVYIR